MNFIISRIFRDRVMRVIDEHPKAVLAGIALYVISPIDLLPEAFLGPLGTFDDILAMIAGVAILKALFKKRRDRRLAEPRKEAAATLPPVASTRRDERSARDERPDQDERPDRHDRPRRDDRGRRNDRRPRRGGR